MSLSRLRLSSLSSVSDVSDTASVVSSRTSIASSKAEAAIHCRTVFLTYAQCSLENKDEFAAMFNEMLERNKLSKATYYGCREPHRVNGIHYHVLLNFGEQVNWSFSTARKCLTVPGNMCDSLNIVTRRRGQNYQDFVVNHVKYCEKIEGGDLFGERPKMSADIAAERKRKWEEIGRERNAASKLAKCKELLPDKFYCSFNNIKGAVEFEHQNEEVYERFELPSYINPSNFRVPLEICQWEFDNLIHPKPGRRQSLIIVGNSRTGKSCLAEYIASQHGVFSSFDTEWDLAAYRDGIVCSVFHDLKKDFPYWKAVIGCQPFLTAHGRYKATRRLKWNVPSIITCTYNEDIRDWGEHVRSYIEQNSVVYEIPIGEYLYLEEKGGGPRHSLGGRSPER